MTRRHRCPAGHHLRGTADGIMLTLHSARPQAFGLSRGVRLVLDTGYRLDEALEGGNISVFPLEEAYSE